MAEARGRTSCATDTPRCKQMMPSVNVYYSDVWTDPAVRTPDVPLVYAYNDTTQFFTTRAEQPAASILSAGRQTGGQTAAS